MFKKLADTVKYWWVLLIIGIISVICGISVLSVPAEGIATLAIIFTINMIALGIGGIIFIIGNRNSISSWGWYLVAAIIILIAGISLAATPGKTMVFIVCMFAIAALVKSIETIVYAFSLSKVEGSGWGWTLILGILGLLCAIFLFAHPLFTGLAVGIFVGISMLVVGIQAIVTSIQLSKIKGKVKEVTE